MSVGCSYFENDYDELTGNDTIPERTRTMPRYLFIGILKVSCDKVRAFSQPTMWNTTGCTPEHAVTTSSRRRRRLGAESIADHPPIVYPLPPGDTSVGTTIQDAICID
jgi:hypothetical protein